MKDNRGITLIELLITVTVLAIVIISAAAFMATGSRSFAKGSADSNVLNSAELAVNQIEDMIIGINGGVDFDDNATTAALTLYHAEDDENGLTVYKKKMVTWHKDAAEPYIDYNEWILTYDDAADSYSENTPLYPDQILAEYVTDFKVDLDTEGEKDAHGNPKMDKDGNPLIIIKSVQVEMHCLDGTGRAAYAATPVITLRNRMMNSDSPGAIFAEAPTSDDAVVLYYSAAGVGGTELPIVNRVTEVQKGGIYNIVARNMGNDVTSEFSFALEAGSISTITGSSLKVDESESETYLTITATANYNSSKKATAVFKVAGESGKSLDSVTIIPKSLNPFSAEYTSVVTCTGMTDAEINNLEYNWYLIGENVANKLTREVSNGGRNIKVNVMQDNGQYKSKGEMFDVQLVVTSGALKQSVSAMVNYRTDMENTISGDSLIEHGKNGTCPGYPNNEYRYNAPDNVVRVEYKHYFCHMDGTPMSAQEKFNDYVEVQGDSAGSYRLHFLQELPPQNEYYLKVEVWCENESGEFWNCYERLHYIPAVRLWGETTKSAANLSSGSNFYYNISGYDANGWASQAAYEVVDFVYDAPDGVTVTATAFGTAPASDIRIGAKLSFAASGYESGAEIILKSVKIKISMKDHPEIYTYATVIFS